MNKKYLYYLGGIAVLILIVWGLSALVKHQAATNWLPTNNNPSLTAEQIQKLNDDLAKQHQVIVANKDKESVFNAFLQSGIDYESFADLAHARDAYLEAAKIDPTSWVPQANLGTVYVQMKNNDAAGAAFRQAITLAPTLQTTWQKWIDFNRYQLQATDQAMRGFYKNSFQATSDNLQLHRDFAAYLESTKAYDDAIAQWQFVLDHSPGDQNTKDQIARLQKLK